MAAMAQAGPCERATQATATAASPLAARRAQPLAAQAMEAARRPLPRAAAEQTLGGCRAPAWPARHRQRRCSTACDAWPKDEGKVTGSQHERARATTLEGEPDESAPVQAMPFRHADLERTIVAAAAAAAPGLRSCALAGCGARERHPSHFKACAACRAVVYCSKEHQVQDWSAHKAACKAARKDASDSGGSSGPGGAAA